MTARKALPSVQEIVGLVCPQCGRDDELVDGVVDVVQSDAEGDTPGAQPR